jgi:hypothetical protein
MLQASPGQQLTGNVGLWVNGVLGYAYQIARDGVVFQSGNWDPGALYTIRQSDVGSVISLMITATNRSGAWMSASSAPVLVVAGVPGPSLIVNLDMSQGTIPIQA